MTFIVVAPATIFAPATILTSDDVVFGDSDGTITNTALSQIFTYTATSNLTHGDADGIADNGRGGDDRITATAVAGSENHIFGDAQTLFDFRPRRR